MLSERVRLLATGPAFAVVASLDGDGAPRGQLMWVDADDEHLLLNTEAHRGLLARVRRDPRIAVVLIDPAEPYSYVEVRGVVEDHVAGDAAREHIDRLSERYFGRPYDASAIASERVMLRVRPVAAPRGHGRAAS